jgi:3-methyladenine DNA glycosylase AlkD
VRRTALLALHDPLLAGQGNFDLFARLAVPMLAEREFFIRKAIGWVLRSTARRQRARTYAFTHAHAAAMSPLTFREAIRQLPADQQERLRRQRLAGSSLPKAPSRRPR